MKAKPIFIIGIPNGDMKIIEDLSQSIANMMSDYHIITYMHNDGDLPKYDAFYEKDFNEVKFEELKKIVKDKLKGK